MKKPTLQEQMTKVESRYGKTLGVSKGRNTPSKGRIRVKPRKSSVKIEYNKKF